MIKITNPSLYQSFMVEKKWTECIMVNLRPIMSSKDYKQTNKVNWRHVSLGEEMQRERETENINEEYCGLKPIASYAEEVNSMDSTYKCFRAKCFPCHRIYIPWLCDFLVLCELLSIGALGPSHSVMWTSRIRWRFGFISSAHSISHYGQMGWTKISCLWLHLPGITGNTYQIHPIIANPRLWICWGSVLC